MFPRVDGFPNWNLPTGVCHLWGAEYWEYSLVCQKLRPLYGSPSAIKAPVRQKTKASKTRSLKNPPSPRLRRAGADWEADFFFIDEVESLPRRVFQSPFCRTKIELPELRGGRITFCPT